MYLPQHGQLIPQDVEGRATGRDVALYEPRAFWQVVDVPFTNRRGKYAAEIDLSGNEWYNGSRYDIIFTSLNVCPIGYVSRAIQMQVMQNLSLQLGVGPSPLHTSFRSSMPLNQAQPNRASTRIQSFADEPVIPPSGNPDVDTGMLSNKPYVFDVCRWQFDQPFRLVRRGMAKFRLTNFCGGDPVSDQFNHAYVGFDEAWSSGGLYRQQMRFAELRLANVGVLAPQRDAITPFGFPPELAGEGTVQTAPLWPPESVFTAREWKEQQGTRGGGDGSGWLQGLTVTLPVQYENDDTGYYAVSLASRIGCEGLTTTAGTGRQWWRKGAPLALVTPTINNTTLTSVLQKPLRLAPNDQVRILLTASDADNLFTAADPAVDGAWNGESGTLKIGISLTGYAVVKD